MRARAKTNNKRKHSIHMKVIITTQQQKQTSSRWMESLFFLLVMTTWSFLCRHCCFVYLHDRVIKSSFLWIPTLLFSSCFCFKYDWNECSRFVTHVVVQKPTVLSCVLLLLSYTHHTTSHISLSHHTSLSRPPHPPHVVLWRFGLGLFVSQSLSLLPPPSLWAGPPQTPRVSHTHT